MLYMCCKHITQFESSWKVNGVPMEFFSGLCFDIGDSEPFKQGQPRCYAQKTNASF